MTSLLTLEHVSIPLQKQDGGELLPVADVSFTVNQGEMVALVGESGCGKTMTALSILGLLPATAKRGALGQTMFKGQNLHQQSLTAWKKLRGHHIATIFQEPASALNPVIAMGPQIAAVLRRHLGLSRSEAKRRTLALFTEVGLPKPEVHWAQFPFHMSGGMRQRAMIAMALSCNPELLIADEPTTALDVTLQEHIMDLLVSLQQKRGMACLLVTHDLALVSRYCHRIVIMYCGTVVEQGHASALFKNPKHPYTKALLETIPHIVDHPPERLPVIKGQVPSLDKVPQGCPFADRCPRVSELCWRMRPQLETSPRKAFILGEGTHAVACHHPLPEANA